jgi:hypothetical protein
MLRRTRRVAPSLAVRGQVQRGRGARKVRRSRRTDRWTTVERATKIKMPRMMMRRKLLEWRAVPQSSYLGLSAAGLACNPWPWTA